MNAVALITLGLFALTQPPPPAAPADDVKRLLESGRSDDPKAFYSFADEDRARIVAAAESFRVEVATGRLWDVQQGLRVQQLRREEESDDPRPRDWQERAETMRVAHSTRDVSGLVLATSVDGGSRELRTENEVKAALANPAPKPAFKVIKIVQVLSESAALIRVEVPGTEEVEDAYLHGFKTDVDGAKYQNIFAARDEKPFVYTTTLGARRTVASYRSTPKPEPSGKSRKVSAEELASAILAGRAVLTEWTVAEEAVRDKPRPGKKPAVVGTIYVWSRKDVTPKPAANPPPPLP